jgi:hypothetical protein
MMRFELWHRYNPVYLFERGGEDQGPKVCLASRIGRYKPVVVIEIDEGDFGIIEYGVETGLFQDPVCVPAVTGAFGYDDFVGSQF